MKLVPTNLVSAASWTNEDTDWPASNAYDIHPKRVTRSTAQTDTLVLTVGANADTVLLVGLVAYSGTVTVKTGGGATVKTDVLSSIERYHWIEYTKQTAQHTIEVALTAAAGEVPEVGLVFAGLRQEFDNPEDGLRYDPIDLSIEHELNNRALYVKDGDVLRSWNGTFQADRDTDFWTFMDFKAAVKKNPFAALILSDFDDPHRYAVYCRFASDPSGRISTSSIATLDFALTEVP